MLEIGGARTQHACRQVRVCASYHVLAIASLVRNHKQFPSLIFVDLVSNQIELWDEVFLGLSPLFGFHLLQLDTIIIVDVAAPVFEEAWCTVIVGVGGWRGGVTSMSDQHSTSAAAQQQYTKDCDAGRQLVVRTRACVAASLHEHVGAPNSSLLAGSSQNIHTRHVTRQVIFLMSRSSIPQRRAATRAVVIPCFCVSVRVCVCVCVCVCVWGGG